MFVFLLLFFFFLGPDVISIQAKKKARREFFKNKRAELHAATDPEEKAKIKQEIDDTIHARYREVSKAGIVFRPHKKSNIEEK